jgi:putative Mg2+ transporter-C (MgtC) family protein
LTLKKHNDKIIYYLYIALQKGETMKEILEGIGSQVTEDYIYVLRMLVAALCGAAIGYERSRRQKDAGIRTHVLVAMGAALMMLVSKYGFFDVVGIEGIRLQADASRIASQVISGVSFLGAGMIFVKDVSIKGLTTAAGVWVTSAVGLAIGAGQFVIGVSATLMIVILQIVLHGFFQHVENTVNEFSVVLVDEVDAIEKFRKHLDSKKISMENYKMHRNKKTALSPLKLQSKSKNLCT